MAVPGTNTIIDISHHQHVTPAIARRIRQSGITAVVHKATEGRDYQDKLYAERKRIFSDLGMLWGSFHFCSGASPIQQIQNYLEYAAPAANELICIDYEPSSSGKNMTFDQLVECADLIHSELGRYPVIYGGHLLRESVRDMTSATLSSCPLWYARYASTPIGIPKNIWDNWTLWQYSDGNAGMEPKHIPGFGNPDRDTFNGTPAELSARWPLS